MIDQYIRFGRNTQETIVAITQDHAKAFVPVEDNHFLVNETWIMSILSYEAPPT